MGSTCRLVSFTLCAQFAFNCLVLVCTRTESNYFFPILYFLAFGRSGWLDTDTYFEQAKAAECTLPRNGML